MVLGVLFLTSALLLANSADAWAQGETAYVVQSGDTLWKLAQRFGTTVDELVNLNDIRDPDLIFVDQVLVLPAARAPVHTQIVGGPLRLSWSLADWRAAQQTQPRG